MYTPKLFAMNDRTEIIDFMRRYSFGIIINSVDGIPLATHLPFIIEERGEDIIIAGHYAKANPQASITEGEVLVIFSEPHAYISPKNYEKEANVPTWNYLAVHAYGKISFLETEQEHIDLLEKSIKAFEQEYLQQWNNLPEDYRHRMIKGITGFEIVVTDLQGKKKLSQNRSEIERQNVIEDLSKSSDTAQSDIAAYMKHAT